MMAFLLKALLCGDFSGVDMKVLLLQKAKKPLRKKVDFF
ncbi:hypothetical protein ALP16_101355 [Pseudomonas savastanoi]|uniref:Uncharacterized protein n=1 Tax=Pseudomonas savastanoi TaxID=29438 RepID=A0A3M5ZRI3_PSESS|nr:hypothetical protein ALO74_101289 [Pseudomonas syringae pv. cunninghamiae]RMV09539.1 hypothetical protein ALP17_105096 [Pseudomonas savastanoi]RMV17577.1 hypothetical protein ALP16_101355 [Pseudomonas savastanoi]RMV19786.1 hypothetical protein ALP15_101258 [Pseudomonas savastanoi]